MKTNIKKGISIVEVLAVVAIICVMGTLIFVSMNESRHRKNAEVAGREVAGAIRLAQNYALTGKNKGNASGWQYPCQFYFIPVSSGNTYQIRYDYHTGSGCTNLANLQNDNIMSGQLKNGAKFKTIATSAGSTGNDNLMFLVPNGNTNINAGGTAKYLIEEGGQYFQICVDVTGDVKEKSVNNDYTDC